MVKKTKKKPTQRPKLSDDELWQILEEYGIVPSVHFGEREEEQKFLRISIVRMLQGTTGKRWHEARRDRWETSRKAWTYAIRGTNQDGEQIRVVIAIDQKERQVVYVTVYEKS